MKRRTLFAALTALPFVRWFVPTPTLPDPGSTRVAIGRIDAKLVFSKGVTYVRSTGPLANVRDGNSWSTAYGSLEDAMKHASPGDTIYVSNKP